MNSQFNHAFMTLVSQ